MTNWNIEHFPNFREEEEMFKRFAAENNLEYKIKIVKGEWAIITGEETYSSYQDFLRQNVDYVPATVSKLPEKRYRKKPKQLYVPTKAKTVVKNNRNNKTKNGNKNKSKNSYKNKSNLQLSELHLIGQAKAELEVALHNQIIEKFLSVKKGLGADKATSQGQVDILNVKSMKIMPTLMHALVLEILYDLGAEFYVYGSKQLPYSERPIKTRAPDIESTYWSGVIPKSAFSEVMVFSTSKPVEDSVLLSKLVAGDEEERRRLEIGLKKLSKSELTRGIAKAIYNLYNSGTERDHKLLAAAGVSSFICFTSEVMFQLHAGLKFIDCKIPTFTLKDGEYFNYTR